jgi:hypothetical protein
LLLLLLLLLLLVFVKGLPLCSVGLLRLLQLCNTHNPIAGLV